VRGLIPRTTAAVASEIARLVAGREDTPVPVIEHLFDCGGTARLTVLKRAPRLDGLRLAVALSGTRAEAKALARRHDLDSEAVAVLLARDDRDILLRLLANPAAPIAAGEAAALVDAGRRDVELGRLLLVRLPPDDPASVRALFLAAGPDLRQRAIAHAETLARLDPPCEALADLAGRAALAAAAGSANPTDLAEALALARIGPAWLAPLIAADSTGEALAIALRAGGLADLLAERCLVLRGPAIGLSAEATLSLVRLHRRLTIAAAIRLLSGMSGESPAPSAAERSNSLAPASEDPPRRAEAGRQRAKPAPRQTRDIRRTS
jgi:hypothetical protein